MVNIDGDALVFTAINVDEHEKIPLVTVKPAYDEHDNIIKQACVLYANAKNKLGEVTLSTEYDNKTYTKVVKVIPLW